MFSTSWEFEVSTSRIAESISWMWSPSWEESALIFFTFSPVCITLSIVCWISSSVFSIEVIIFAEVSSKWISASRIWPEEVLVSALSLRISSATTAKPLPASPALAASMEAFSAKRLVWLEMLSMVPVSSFTISNSSLKSCSTWSTSEDNVDISCVVSIRLSRSEELFCACTPDSRVSSTISSIMAATCCTCALMSVVISMEEDVRSCNCVLFPVNSFMPSITTSAPCLFSEASSRTTVTPSKIELLAVFTFSTVVTTRCKSDLILSVIAPSESFRCWMERT